MLRKVRGDTASTSNFCVTITLPPKGFRIHKEVTGMSPFVGVYPDVDKVQRGFQFHASLLGTRLTGVFHAQPVESETTVSHLVLRGSTSVRTRLFRPWTYLLGT